MKKINRSLGQKKRKAKNDLAKGCLVFLWTYKIYNISTIYIDLPHI
jgi:hypothetical protein